MKVDHYRLDGSHPCNLSDLPCAAPKDAPGKAEAKLKTAANLERLAELQDRFYADGREGLIVILQALDAAGKDSTIKHVMSGLNPQGVKVTSFKQPSSEELRHDYLWRVHKALPERGQIAIFNRSYYEDVLVVQVHNMQKNYHMAPRVLKDAPETFFEKRYRQIRGYEEYLYENSFRVLKIFLHLSKDEQKKRFLQRIDTPAKNWKFSAADVEERQYFERYNKTFERVIDATATEHSPWYALPADDKWYTRLLVSELMVNALERCAPAYPTLSEEDQARLADCRARLLAEED